MSELKTSSSSEAMVSDLSPPTKIETLLVTHSKAATARIRGGTIVVQLPKRWPQALQRKVSTQLVERIHGQFHKDMSCLRHHVSPMVSLNSLKDLETWVFDLNTRTLDVPLKSVRIGHARYSRLAQMNTRTAVMTVSRYCLESVPEDALRYLLIHELAHLKVPNHSKAFWALVAEHVPNYRMLREVMSAFHRMKVYEAGLSQQPSPPIQTPALFTPPSQLNLFASLRQLISPR